MVPALAASILVGLLAAPLAIRVARRLDFVDVPRGYKMHRRPTPYLGGAVVLAGVIAGAAAGGALGDSHLTAIFIAGVCLWALGTLDDRVGLGPYLRVAGEALVAVYLWESDLGWSLFPGEAADLVVTILWVVGIVNAFNLMDNLDGAAGTVAAVSAGGVAVLAGSNDLDHLAAFAIAVSGATLAFLMFNLSRPPRIFLGDGGSMLLGCLLATVSMATWRDAGLDGIDLLPLVMLMGVAVLDMTLVIFSRLRRGAELASGNRDHTTHRLLPKLGSERAVALALAVAQAVLCALGLALIDQSPQTVLLGSSAAALLGIAVIAVLEAPAFRCSFDSTPFAERRRERRRLGSRQRVPGSPPSESWR